MDFTSLTRPSRLLRSALPAVLASLFALQAPSLAAAELTEQEMKRGRIQFLQCRACHSLKPADNQGKIGPSLAGVFGRAAGSADYYENYSAALRGAGHEWNAETMNQWLKGPAAMVAGTSMVFAGIADDAQRELLVRYLEVITAVDPE